MNYAGFLQWGLKNLPKFKRAIELLAEIAALFSVEDVGALGIELSQEMAIEGDCLEVTTEEEQLEQQVIEALTADGSMTQAAFDGSRLRKAFEFLQKFGPMIPVLISLFGKMS